MKDVLWGDNVRSKLMEGIEILNNTVKITLGPKGKNVILEKFHGSPLITKDGVTVAKEIDLKDKFQNMGAQIIKEVASKTSETAGDGTTTATILAHFMIKEGMKYITSGVNPMDLKRGIEKATSEAVKELKNLTKSCSSLKEISQVASISANNDENIGMIISKAVERIGKEGVISIEDGKSLYNELEIVEGLQFDRGYMSPYFINNQENQSSRLENAFILICNKKINTINELIPVLELISKSNRSLLIMAEEIDNETLATLILNNIKGVLKLSAVKLPGFGEKRKELLDDIAILTGGTVITDELSLSIENVSLADFGQAKKIEVYKEKTIIIDGSGIPCNISQRVKDLNQQIVMSNSQYEIEKLQERLSKLSNGIAIIRVGATTELEMKEKKARFEDALHATRAAIEEGIVAGGGVTLLKVKNLLRNLKGENEDQNSGIKLVLKSMEEPLKQILLNAGEEFNMILTNILNNSEDIDYGYNVVNRSYGNLIDLGVIDPTKVTRTALQNASSIASLLLTTDAGVVEIKKSNNSKIVDDDEDLDDLDV